MLASFLEPWPMEPSPAAAIGQLVLSDALAILMVAVTAALVKTRRGT